MRNILYRIRSLYKFGGTGFTVTAVCLLSLFSSQFHSIVIAPGNNPSGGYRIPVLHQIGQSDFGILPSLTSKVKRNNQPQWISTSLESSGIIQSSDDLLPDELRTGDRHYVIQEIEIAEPQVAFSGVSAGNYDPQKIHNWNKYFYPYLISAEGTALRNIYATELVYRNGEYVLFYGGYNSDNPADTTDRIYSAKSSNFIKRDLTDFSAPTWGDRRLVIDSAVGVANDPSIIYVDGTYIMHFSSSEPPVDGVKLQDRIQYSVSSDLDNWNLDYEDPSRYIQIIENWDIIDFMQRPSLVYDNGTYYVYFDQGLDPDTPKNNGFTIKVATSDSNAIFFNYVGEVLPPGSPENGNGASAEVEKFNNGWLMFYDRRINSLAYATSADGLTFVDNGDLYTSSNSFTNVNVIRDNDRLLGVTYGEFPTLDEYESDGDTCPYPYGTQYCLQEGKVNAVFLQKKVVFEGSDGRVFSGAWAVDEDKLFLNTNLNVDEELSGIVKIYDTDGSTLLHEQPLDLKPHTLYNITLFSE